MRMWADPLRTCLQLTDSPRAQPRQSLHRRIPAAAHRHGALTAAVRSAQARPQTGGSQSPSATRRTKAFTLHAPLRASAATDLPGQIATPAPRDRGCGFDEGADGDLLCEDVPVKGSFSTCFITDLVGGFISNIIGITVGGLLLTSGVSEIHEFQSQRASGWADGWVGG